jgi:hypothetical protein
MKLLTVESVTREALKILNQSFDDAYAKQYRTTIGGNEYVHNVQRETPADSAGTAGIEQQTV